MRQNNNLQPASTMSVGLLVQTNNAVQQHQGQGASTSVTTTAHLVFRSPTEEMSASLDSRLVALESGDESSKETLSLNRVPTMTKKAGKK